MSIACVLVPRDGREESKVRDHIDKMKAYFQPEVKFSDVPSPAECKKEMAMAGLVPDTIEKNLPLMMLAKTLEAVAKADHILMSKEWESDDICRTVKEITKGNEIDFRIDDRL